MYIKTKSFYRLNSLINDPQNVEKSYENYFHENTSINKIINMKTTIQQQSTLKITSVEIKVQLESLSLKINFKNGKNGDSILKKVFS